MKPITVLLTSMGSTTAIGVVKSFRMQHEYNVKVVGTDINKPDRISGSAFCDFFSIVPPAADENEYMETLLGLIERYDIDLVIPITDEELEVIAKYSDRIRKRSFLLLSPYETIRTCNDKYLTYNAMQSYGIPTLDTMIPSPDILEKIKNSGLTYPLIVKPRKGRGSQDLYRLNSPDDLVLLSRVENPLIQEYAPGPLHIVDMFCSGHTCSQIITRKNTILKAGVAYQSEISNEPSLVDYSMQIAKSMDFIGPVDVQWLFTAKGPRLLEINPRFNASSCFNAYCGCNHALCALRMADTGDPGPLCKPELFRMCRYWNEVYHSLEG
jgi:carbamoyl-phosphate synthase large subunit